MSGKTSNAAKTRWNAKTYDQLNTRFPKGERDSIQAAATAAGLSLNGYVVTAVHERMERDGFQIPASGEDQTGDND